MEDILQSPNVVLLVLRMTPVNSIRVQKIDDTLEILLYFLRIVNQKQVLNTYKKNMRFFMLGAGWLKAMSVPAEPDDTVVVSDAYAGE